MNDGGVMLQRNEKILSMNINFFSFYRFILNSYFLVTRCKPAFLCRDEKTTDPIILLNINVLKEIHSLTKPNRSLSC